MKERFDPLTPRALEARERFEELTSKGKSSERTKAHGEALLLNAETFYKKRDAAGSEHEKERFSTTIAIAEAVQKAGGSALIVGGAARDDVLARLGYTLESKDIDIEVYGLQFARLQKILQSIGEIEVVGANFGVVKMKGVDVDISIPRRDSKTGPGHKGFDIEGDPDMSVTEAARRRDFTINALAMDPLTGEIIDKYGGLRDIQKGVLRATDPKLFKDDPLRVLRAMQFAARFEFSIDPKTIELCRGMDLAELSPQRIGEEWKKLLLRAEKPSIGLEAARELGILEKLHPEVHALIDVPQEPEWHPEGDVWTHTKMVVDEASAIVRREGLVKEEALVVMLGALCHDLGKPATTEKNEQGRITSRGHAEAGIEPTKNFLSSLHPANVSQETVAKVSALVKEHLFPALNPEPSDAAVRRLSARLLPASTQELLRVAEADHRGRAMPWDGFPSAAALLEKAEQLQVKDTAPEPFLRGRDLLSLGLQENPRIGSILRAVYEVQLAGDVATHEEALEKAKQFLPEYPET